MENNLCLTRKNLYFRYRFCMYVQGIYLLRLFRVRPFSIAEYSQVVCQTAQEVSLSGIRLLNGAIPGQKVTASKISVNKS